MPLHRPLLGCRLVLATCVAVLVQESFAQQDTVAQAPAAQPGTQSPAQASPVPQLQLAPLQLQLAPSLLQPPAPSGGGLAARVAPGPTEPVGSLPLRLAPIGEASGPIFLRADHVEGIAQNYVEATGRVELRSRSETVLADWLRYDVQNDEVWGKGNVVIRRGIDWITGPEARFKRDTETGYFTSPHYSIAEVGGRGDAAEIKFIGPERYDLFNARYTTCTAPSEDWYIRVDELEVDKTRMVGTGHGATIHFLGTPIAYAPWLEFPLSNERKTGFLTPTLGYSGTRGFDAALPYYLNLAPNYDATITPRLMTKRGLQVGGQFRYLFPTFQGETDVEYMPRDREIDSERWGISSRHTQSLAPGLAGFWNYNKVSDDTYFTDLSDRVALTSQSTLSREAGLTYTRGPFSALAQVQSFQTLQDPTTAPVTPPYDRLPQILATLRDTDWMGLTFAGAGEYANFHEPALPVGVAPLPTGQRIYLWPTVAWMRQGAAWNFVARTGVHMRHYDIDQPTPGLPTSLNYAVPITSLDGSLIFERDWTAFGHNFLQTLEPRAFYVYTPFRDQHEAPVFDSALDDFNFAQLFSVNRYLGNDRIGDASQLALAVTSRLIDSETGAERVRFAVGQRYYFSNQQVTLNETPRSASSSDILVLGEGRLSESWALAGLLQQNLDTGRTERFNGGFRYTPAPGKTLNFGYRYSRVASDVAASIFQSPEIKQFDISTQWPITANWTFLGRWNYSIFDSKTLEAVIGVEYNAGCWAFRLVGQRLTTNSQTTSNSVYLQLELTGLARIGTSPLELLRRSVPGYLKTNDPLVNPRERGDYFPEF